MDNVVWTGHFEIVTYLHEHRREGCATSTMNMAAARGKLDVVKYLHENRLEGCTVNAIDMAVLNNREKVASFLLRDRHEGSSPQLLNNAVHASPRQLVSHSCASIRRKVVSLKQGRVTARTKRTKLMEILAY